MGILNRVKQLVGMGVELEVDIPYKYLTPGSLLTYTITLTSEADIELRSVTTDVLEGSAAPGSPGWGGGPAAFSALPLENLALTADKPYIHAGSITLPEDAALSVNDPDDPHYWALRVVADLPMGIDPMVVVGFVVGPKAQMPWEIEGPLAQSIAGAERQVRASGTCTVVESPEQALEETQQIFRDLLPNALRDLLSEYPDLLKAGPPSAEQLDRLSNELREIINPRLRENNDSSLDSIAGLTISELVQI